MDINKLLIDFGATSELSKKIISVLYLKILSSNSSRSFLLFEEWRRIFSLVCAYSKDKLLELNEYYKVDEEKSSNVEKLMFSVHTFYSLLIKLLTSEIITLCINNFSCSYLARLEELCTKGLNEMKSEFQKLEAGEIFKELGIRTFLESDYFSWYLDEWDNELADCFKKIIKKLMSHDFTTIKMDQGLSGDLFKRLYQNLVPREVRHKLGEYFTPDWLADLLLNEVGYDGNPNDSLLDPSCGSGTFLLVAIKRIKHFAEQGSIDKITLFKKILKNIKGIDLNPLAVQASKANYLIALANLLQYRPREGIEIPVYFADSILINEQTIPAANSLTPLSIGQFDFVVGNPPWIGWEYLPPSYREETTELWQYYGLLNKTKGKGLGKVKRDMAMLFTARCLDKYLKNRGKYAFLIPFTTFKTQAGAGFRQFLAKGNSAKVELPCKVIKVHDLVELYPFEGAVNRTAMILIEKRWGTQFPIPCIVWHNPTKKSIPMNANLIEVRKITKQFEMVMIPIKENMVETQWMTVHASAKDAIQKIRGNSPWYEAHMGVKTALNLAYWVKIISEAETLLSIQNARVPGQKKPIKDITCPVEYDLLYPMNRGRDLRKWYCQSSDLFIITPHDSKTGKPLKENIMKTEYPHTYNYFIKLKDELDKRSIHQLWGKDYPFYSLYDIGSYTFSTYKVAWKAIAGPITGKAVYFASAVLEPQQVFHNSKLKPIIPDNSIISIPFENRDEAYYVSALLNSIPILFIIASYTYELRMETHITKNVFIPQYDSTNILHQKLSKLSENAHHVANQIYKEHQTELISELETIEENIDLLVTELYQLTSNELEAIKNTYMILKEGRLAVEKELEDS